jgi:arylsulfatase A-like enzyme
VSRLTPQSAGSRPNIVFLLTDDQRWDSLGCMGNRIVRTPNIDRLSEQGVTFDNHFVTTSICMASRASILTGLYSSAHRINDFRTPLTPEQYARTYPELLRRSGYHVAFIGKYGVGDKMPEDRFDYWKGFPGQGRYFTPERRHLTEVMGDQSLEFLTSAPRTKAFCLSVSFKAPHVQDDDPRQFLPSPGSAELYKDVNIPVPETADTKYLSALPIETHRSEMRRRWAVRFSTPELYQESVKNYYRLITEVDTVVGRIRDQLRSLGADRNTIIVFSADNGFYLGEHGMAGKWLMHEESIRTPLIVFDPRDGARRRGARIDEMSLNIDIAPTLLDYAGLKPPPSMQGRSLAAAPPQRSEWFYEHHFTNGWIPRTEGIRTAAWKYTRYLDTEPVFEELYNLAQDPKEKQNLVRSPEHAERLSPLRSRWRAWRENLRNWSPDREWEPPGGAAIAWHPAVKSSAEAQTAASADRGQP